MLLLLLLLILPFQVEWTKQLVAQQRQLTETIKKETEKIKAVMDAEREKEVDLIDIQKSIQVRSRRTLTASSTTTFASPSSRERKAR